MAAKGVPPPKRLEMSPSGKAALGVRGITFNSYCTCEPRGSVMDDTSKQNERRHFFVQLVDGDSGYAINEFECGQHDPTAVAQEFGCKVEDLLADRRLELDREKVNVANRAFNLSIDPDFEYVDLYSWSESDSLPYRPHSNRELPLMLAGLKPLSVFSAFIPSPEDGPSMPEYLFDPYIADGLFTKTEYCVPMQHLAPRYLGMRNILYARRGEEWRINAYILVDNLADKIGWNEPLTRLQGSLLGYEEWQNDLYWARANRLKQA